MKKLLVATALTFLFSTAAFAQLTSPTEIIDPGDGGGGGGGGGTGGGGTSQPKLTYHGGSVVQNAKMTYIFWGWASGGAIGSGEYTSELIAFRKLSMPGHMGMLAQYNATQSANLLNTGVPDVYDPSTPPAYISDLDVQHEIQKYFHDQIDPWNIYVVVLPPGVTVSDRNGQLSCSATSAGFCAYHNNFWDSGTWGNTRARYAVIPYPVCCRPDGFSDAMTAEVQIIHEVRETITNPHFDAWYDSYGREADDKCHTLTFFERAPAPPPYYNRTLTFGLQQEWSNAANGCVQ